MPKLNIKGMIIPNDYKWYFDWFDMDSTCPRDVEKILNDANGGEIEVYINSPGGVIESGSEIYSLLRDYKGAIKIYIMGEACSAASVIAMAGYCEMSPTALMMVHCVSTGANGNHGVFEKTAAMLRTADEALSNAYVAKSGMTKDEALKMMENETWLTAEQAKNKGLIDAVMFDSKEQTPFVASSFSLPSIEKMEQLRKMINEQEPKNTDPVFLIQQKKAQINLMRLKGDF